MSLPGRVLALDLGKRRTGVAVSDALRLTVRPVTTLTTGLSRRSVEAVAALVSEHGVKLVVIGDPRLASGDPGRLTAAAAAFAARLTEATGVPVVLWDESGTSQAADALRRQGTATGVGQDAVAAAILLQEYLRAATEAPGPSPVRQA